jgi:hypothetical protein
VGKVPVRVETECLGGAPRSASRAEFFDNGQQFGEATAAPLAADWEPGKANSGNHVLSAVVQDGALGEMIRTGEVAVQVAPPTRPLVRLTAPAAGTQVIPKKEHLLLLEADVAFPDSCTRGVTVRFRADDSLIAGAERQAPPYRWYWDISGLKPGKHQINVEAIDSADNRPITAFPVVFTVEQTMQDKVIVWLRDKWYVPALLAGLLLLFVLLLVTRRQVRKAVGGAAQRVRDTILGPPNARVRGTLKTVRGLADERTFNLTDGRNTIGSAQECTARVEGDGWISGSHFHIDFAVNGDATLTDVGRHGTMVDGRRVTPNQPVPLHGGERIRAGTSEFEFQLVRGSPTKWLQRQ